MKPKKDKPAAKPAPKPKPARQRGVCSLCQQLVLVKKDGTVAAHKGKELQHAAWRPECAGAGWPPLKLSGTNDG